MTVSFHVNGKKKSYIKEISRVKKVNNFLMSFQMVS